MPINSGLVDETLKSRISYGACSFLTSGVSSTSIDRTANSTGFVEDHLIKSDAFIVRIVISVTL